MKDWKWHAAQRKRCAARGQESPPSFKGQRTRLSIVYRAPVNLTEPNDGVRYAALAPGLAFPDFHAGDGLQMDFVRTVGVTQCPAPGPVVGERRVVILVASEDATSGSVIAKAERISPVSSGSSHCSRCAGVALQLLNASVQQADLFLPASAQKVFRVSMNDLTKTLLLPAKSALAGSGDVKAAACERY